MTLLASTPGENDWKKNISNFGILFPRMTEIKKILNLEIDKVDLDLDYS